MGAPDAASDANVVATDARSDGTGVEDARVDAPAPNDAGPDAHADADAAPTYKCTDFVQFVVQPGTCLQLACPGGNCEYFEKATTACGTAMPVPACVDILNTTATTLAVFAAGPVAAEFIPGACVPCH
jgi:hypothetical protein